MKCEKTIRSSLQLVFVVLACGATVATTVIEDDAGPEPLEEPDTDPCGEALEEKSISISQGADTLAENDRVTISVGGSGQGGDGDEGIDVYVHLAGVRSDDAQVTGLSIRFETDADETAASFTDADGGFYCFSGAFRTRIIQMALNIDSFDIDGKTGRAQVELTLDGDALSYELPVRF